MANVYMFVCIYIDREAENNPSPARPNDSSRAYSAG